MAARPNLAPTGAATVTLAAGDDKSSPALRGVFRWRSNSAGRSNCATRRPALRRRAPHLARSPRPHAAQPQVGVVAADGARASPQHRRPDLAAVHHRRRQQARARSIDAGRLSPVGRPDRARGRARDEADDPLHRAVSLHRSVAARRNRKRGTERRQPRLPRDPRREEGVPGYRRTVRCRARSLHQPRP